MRALPGRLLRLFCILVLALHASLLFRSTERTLDRPLTEDGYYSLAIARNIAQGLGPTVDGVRPTNGFQPLFTLLTVPLFWIGGEDPIAPLRLMLLIHLLVHAATAALLGGIAAVAWREAHAEEPERSARDVAWLTAFLYLVAVGTFLQHWNGLETGFSLFLIVLAWRVAQRMDESWSGAARLGIVLGLAVLARIDAAILVAIVALAELRAGAFGGAAWARAAAISIVAALVSLPWWLFNLLGFGSLMPTSGRAQQEFLISGERIERALTAWLADAVPWMYARRGGALLADGLRLVVLVPVLFAFRGDPVWTRDSALLGRTRRFGLCLVAFTFVLAVWYGVSSWASHFYVRYLSALIPVATLTFAFAGARLARRVPAAATAAIAVLLVAFMGWVVVALHQGAVFGRNLFYEDQLALIREHVPATDWVAAGQTGTLGYFRDRVLNLDGKVNAEVHPWRHDIAGYLDAQGVRWFCDWPWFVEQYLGRDPAARGWMRIGQRGEFRLYLRKGAPPS